MTSRRAGFAWCVCAVLAGCSPGAAPASAKPEVLVFAASSVVTALDALAARFERESGAVMKISYGSSATLAQQIRNGAPADLFLSADPAWADALMESGDVSRRSDFLGNSLVLIVPAATPDLVNSSEDLAKEAVRRVAIGDPASVPAGRYAKEALDALGFWEKLEPKLVPAMDVRQALAYVERGEVDAGIVYATDAKSSAAVRVVAVLDAHLKEPVRYSLVQIKRAPRNAKTEAAFDFLISDGAMAEFSAAGFTRPRALGQ